MRSRESGLRSINPHSAERPAAIVALPSRGGLAGRSVRVEERGSSSLEGALDTAGQHSAKSANFLRWIVWGSALSLVGLLGAQLVRADSGLVQFRVQMSVEEFERCGLHKLTSAELRALEAWVARRSLAPVVESEAPRALISTREGGQSAERVVSFNVSTHKYHCPSCQYARKCTRNCVEISLAQALERGGVACRWCGGKCG